MKTPLSDKKKKAVTFRFYIGQQKIKFKLPRGSLIAVVGPPKSGKSDLLRAILGHVYRGTAAKPRSTGYVSRTPWVFEGSIRENIVLDRVMNVEHYEQVLTYCGLKEVLESGADTDPSLCSCMSPLALRCQIGLARALYLEDRCLLLDAPLADIPNGSLRRRLRRAYLSCKLTRFLVTYDQADLLKADRIVVMHDGSVSKVCASIQEYKRYMDWCLFHEEELPTGTDELIMDSRALFTPSPAEGKTETSFHTPTMETKRETKIESAIDVASVQRAMSNRAVVKLHDWTPESQKADEDDGADKISFADLDDIAARPDDEARAEKPRGTPNKPPLHPFSPRGTPNKPPRHPFDAKKEEKSELPLHPLVPLHPLEPHEEEKEHQTELPLHPLDALGMVM